MGKLRSRPPTGPSVDEFISGASTQTVEVTQPVTEAPPKTEEPAAKQLAARKKKRYPWESSAVRKDVTKVYNLRLPEEYMLKLKHIAEYTPDSMQKFCLDALLPAIDRKLKALERESDDGGQSELV